MNARFGTILLLLSLSGCFPTVDVNKPKPADVPELVSRVQNPELSIDDRAAAIEALGILLGEGRTAVPVLIECLDDDQLRRFASDAIVEIGKPAVGALSETAQDVDVVAARRLDVIAILGRIGPDAEAAVPALVDVYKGDDRKLSRAAGGALSRVGGPAVPSVVKLLEDDDPRVQLEAVQMLARMGPSAADAAPALVALLPNATKEMPVGEALSKMGDPALDALCLAMSSGETKTRTAAAAELWRFQKSKSRALATLNQTMKDPDPAVRLSTAKAIGALRYSPDDVAPLLIASLKDDDAAIRATVATALGQLRPTREDVTTAVLSALGDRDAQVRKAALDAIPGMARTTPAIKLRWNDLATPLHDDNAEVRGAAASVIFQLKIDSPDAVDLLLGALKDPHEDVRAYSAGALGNIGPRAERAVAPLAALFHDEHAFVRDHARTALIQIGKPAVPYVVQALDDESLPARKLAIEAVAGLLAPTKSDKKASDKAHPWVSPFSDADLRMIVPKLAAALGDPKLDGPANWALRQCGPAALPALPQILDLVEKSDDAKNRAWLATILGHIGPSALISLGEAAKTRTPKVRAAAALGLGGCGPDALPILVDLLNDKEIPVRLAAIEALGRLGSAAVPTLIGALDDSNDEVRRGAMVALRAVGQPAVLALADSLAGGKRKSEILFVLGNIGPAANDAVPSMLELLDDGDPVIRNAAKSAVSQINPKALREAVRK